MSPNLLWPGESNHLPSRFSLSIPLHTPLVDHSPQLKPMIWTINIFVHVLIYYMDNFSCRDYKMLDYWYEFRVRPQEGYGEIRNGVELNSSLMACRDPLRVKKRRRKKQLEKKTYRRGIISVNCNCTSWCIDMTVTLPKLT